jgi:hypothetical protein
MLRNSRNSKVSVQAEFYSCSMASFTASDTVFLSSDTPSSSIMAKSAGRVICKTNMQGWQQQLAGTQQHLLQHLKSAPLKTQPHVNSEPS